MDHLTLPLYTCSRAYTQGHSWNRKWITGSSSLAPGGTVVSLRDRAVWVQALARVIVLCCWGRHASLTLPLSMCTCTGKRNGCDGLSYFILQKPINRVLDYSPSIPGIGTNVLKPVTCSELSAVYLTVFVEQLKHCVYHVRIEHLPSRYINSSLEFFCGAKEIEISNLCLTSIL